MLLVLFGKATAADSNWKHSGSLYIITTPEGVSLPSTASEKDFPLLVRLDKDFFDFRQARTHGEDIRFTSGDGASMAYQIEQWDKTNGTASIWVKIPNIQGNARQAIKMYWGKADAISKSSGSAVFNESNGYLSVVHLSDPINPVKDEVGTLTPTNAGTTASAGMIGGGRHFAGGQGINGGENITTYPTGSNPHSSQAWFRADAANGKFLCWGMEQGQGKVIMKIASPPHIMVECYFSGADVAGGSTTPFSQWIHVVHTYKNGDSRIYVNGLLDGVSTSTASPLAIPSPARMYIGGWYNNYDFVGDIDEVRISNVTRSANWVKMEYENQKPLQTLAGLLVPAGSDFSVSQTQITVLEGKSAALTASAGGAQKVYWILKDGDKEKIYAVDRFNLSFNAGRVVGDKSFTLQFKAIYANEIKTKDIAVLIKEDIPEPIFALTSPKKWDGRETIEVAARIINLREMQAKDTDELSYNWNVSGLAVIKEIEPGKLTLKRAQNSGKLSITLTLDNGGAATTQTATMTVNEPKHDPWVQRTPAKDEKPEDNQFYARDDKNEGTLYCNGTLEQNADSLFLKLYADDKLVRTITQQPTAEKSYAFTVKLKPGLIKYKVELGYKRGNTETILHKAGNIVCGDAYIIEGQSNALATDTGEESPRETNDWIRSYARPRYYRKGETQNLWCNPVWKSQRGHKAELGWWGMELAKRLVKSQKMPVFIINGAVGGTRIDQHQRNPENHEDLRTIYGRLLWRVRQAKLTHGIRAVLWHQGESDQGAQGPDGDYGWKTYQQYFVEMSAAWKEDFPNIQHYYVFQIWPNSCSMGNGHGDMLREVQRTLPRLYSNMDIMPTLGIKPPGPCHFPLIGWTEFARLIQPLIERDFYGKAPTDSITAPNLKKAYYATSANDAIVLEFDQPVVWKDSLNREFYLDGAKGKVASGAVSGSVLTLKLKEASAAKKITYLKEMSWNQQRLLYGENGIAALTFCNVPISKNSAAR